MVPARYFSVDYKREAVGLTVKEIARCNCRWVKWSAFELPTSIRFCASIGQVMRVRGSSGCLL